jgi:hypothetical protein
MIIQLKEGVTSTASRKPAWAAHFGAATWICFLTLGTTAAALVQNYAVDPHTIASGGGASSNGSLAIAGTIGQPAAGSSRGGRYVIDGGYWGFIAAVQAPWAPRLSIRLTATHTIVLSWPSPSTQFILQSSASLSAGNWSPVTSPTIDDGTTRSVVITQPGGNQFFRLVRP